MDDPVAKTLEQLLEEIDQEIAEPRLNEEAELIQKLSPTLKIEKQFRTTCDGFSLTTDTRISILGCVVEYRQLTQRLDDYPLWEARLNHLRKIYRAANGLADLQVKESSRPDRRPNQIQNRLDKLRGLLTDNRFMDRIEFWLCSVAEAEMYEDLNSVIKRLPNSAAQLARCADLTIAKCSRDGHREKDLNKRLFEQKIHDILFGSSDVFPTATRSGLLVEMLTIAYRLSADGDFNAKDIARHAAREIVDIRKRKLIEKWKPNG